jgi:hypothetical protein
MNAAQLPERSYSAGSRLSLADERTERTTSKTAIKLQNRANQSATKHRGVGNDDAADGRPGSVESNLDPDTTPVLRKIDAFIETLRAL